MQLSKVKSVVLDWFRHELFLLHSVARLLWYVLMQASRLIQRFPVVQTPPTSPEFRQPLLFVDPGSKEAPGGQQRPRV